MIPFCWLVGGGDQERMKEVELTLAAIRSSGGALGAENEILNKETLIKTKSCKGKHDSVNIILYIKCTSILTFWRGPQCKNRSKWTSTNTCSCSNSAVVGCVGGQ